jgi:uncharacterized protein (TIGR01319 family)
MLASIPSPEAGAKAGGGSAVAAGAGAFPVLIAGNRNAAAVCEKILAGREVIRCPNVMPAINKLNIEPVQDEIRKLFLRRIIHAKGLSREQELISGILMPTPQAVRQALDLLSHGTEKQPGLGELAAADPGGATTDVYSVARGLPKQGDVILKGLPEPESKRTVEGDIGMRYSAAGVLEAVGAPRLAALAGCSAEAVTAWVERAGAEPDILPGNPAEEAMDAALVSAAVETAMARHAGTIEEAYTPAGKVFVQTGKDLTDIPRFILTGGAAIRNRRAVEIASQGFYNTAGPGCLCPRRAKVYLDKSYILAAMGLLSETLPDAALSIMKKEIQVYGTGK